MLLTHAEYNLPFALKVKRLPESKGTKETKSLDVHHPLLTTLSNAPPPPLIVHQDNKAFPQFPGTGNIILRLGNYLLFLFADLQMPDI